MTLFSNKNRVILDLATFPRTGESKYFYHSTVDGFFYYWNEVNNSYTKLDNALDVLTDLQPTPLATGNTANLNTVFKDANNDTWIVDSQGDAILAGSVFNETITDVTNTVTGHKIATYTNEDGDTTDINETITVISLGANNTISYISENGQTTNLDLTPILGDKYHTTSTTCQNISTASGNITMQVSPGLSYIPLQTIIMQDASNSGNHLHCDIVSYNKTTGELVVNVKQKSGSGSVCNWLINVDSFNVTSTSVVVTQTNTSGDKIGSITVNGVTTDLFEKADIPYSKHLFVDPINGSDTTGTGSDNKMFKTIAKALTVANSSGYRIVLAAGNYVENISISQQNLDIVTVSGAVRGNTLISGSVTFTNTASSSGIHGISMTSLVVSGAGSVYVKDSQVNTTFTKSSNGYLEVLDSEVVGVSITGAGQAVFIAGKQTGFTVNNAGAIVTVKDSNNLAVTTVTAGTLGVLSSIGFASTANGKAITASAGTTVFISNSQFYGSTGLITGLTLSGSYGIDDVQFDKVNSTLGTNLSTIGWFDKVGIINPATITTATKMLVRDTNGVVSEQLLPVGGALWYSGASTPTATGNTAASLGVAALPANYTNTTTGVIYYVDANGVAKAIEGRLTTSLLGRNGNGTTYVNPTMASDTKLVDAFLLSDGTFAHVGQIKYPAHGLVKHAYYFGSATSPYFTITPPTSGILQQVFYVIDENTIDIDIEQGVTIDLANYANVVYVNNVDVNAGTIYDTNNPPTTNNNALKGDVGNLYIGSDGSLWVWNGTAYVTKPATSNTEWWLGSTQVDAGSNKTQPISRTGNVAIGKNISTTIPVDVYGTGAAQYSVVARFTNPDNTVVGNHVQMVFGTQQGSGNAADWRFFYAGNSSVNNRVDFGMSGRVAPIISYLYGGNVGVNNAGPVSNLDVNGSFGFAIRGAGSSTSQTETDGTVVFTSAFAVYTLLAPTASNNRRVIAVKNQTTGNISVVGNIDGVAGTTYTIQGGGGVIFQSNGSSWWAIADNTPTGKTQVSARANRGTDLTLDNLKFRVAATGNASLQVSTVSGTATLNGNSYASTEAFGLVSALAVTTTPTYVRPALAFANAGDTQRFLFNTTDNKSYEVRLVIDPGYTSNLIHIQRLH
jgi:hypothetical protein